MGRQVPVSVVWKNKNFVFFFFSFSSERGVRMHARQFLRQQNIVSEKVYKVQMSCRGNLPIHCVLDIISYKFEFDK